MALTVPASNRTLILLLPARERLRGGKRLPIALAQLLGRGDQPPDALPGRDAQLLRVFDVLPRRVPVAALTRQLDADDAGQGKWLRCDPAYVRADMTQARMLACGELSLTSEEVEALVAALRPLFGDEGFPISAPVAARWYLQLPAQSKLPDFASPEIVLGDDLHSHMPVGDEGRRWRRLMNDAQIILHNHPVNLERVERGQLPANSLWFWGGGALPDHVRAADLRIASGDPVVAALARQAKVPLTEPFAGGLTQASGPNVIDLFRLRDIDELAEPWLERAMSAVSKGTFDALLLDFADGAQRVWRHANRWRIWRKPENELTRRKPDNELTRRSLDHQLTRRTPLHPLA